MPSSAEHGEREGPRPARLTRRLDQRREPRDRIEPCRRDGHAGFRHLLLKPGIERRRSLAHLEQAVPLPHGALVASSRPAHLRIDGKHQPVEEAPPLGGWTGEQAVHLGDHPNELHIVGESAGALILAGDAHVAACALRLRRKARSRCRSRPRLRATSPWRPPPSRRGRPCGRVPHRDARASLDLHRAATRPRADWSCPRRCRR